MIGLRLAEFRADEKLRRKRVEPTIIAGMIHSNPLINELCRSLSLEMNILSTEKFREVSEMALMLRADVHAKKMRVWEYQQELKAKSAKRTIVSSSSAADKVRKP